jgi:hypothetical protein
LVGTSEISFPGAEEDTGFMSGMMNKNAHPRINTRKTVTTIFIVLSIREISCTFVDYSLNKYFRKI